MSNFYPRQAGTTNTTFTIGAGNGKVPFTIDTGVVATPSTWILPATNGTAGYVLSNDGTGTLSWVAVGAASDSTTPYYVPVGETFTNNINRQNLFTTDIVVDGILEINGMLLEVN